MNSSSQSITGTSTQTTEVKQDTLTIRPVSPVGKGQTIQREPGDQVFERIVITEPMVHAFADLTGDHNPIHVDPEAGRQSIFGGNIVHGMLTGSFFGPLLVNQLIGVGAIYLKQTLEFEAAVPVGSVVQVILTVLEVKRKTDKSIYTLQTQAFLENETRVLNGQAIILVYH